MIELHDSILNILDFGVIFEVSSALQIVVVGDGVIGSVLRLGLLLLGLQFDLQRLNNTVCYSILNCKRVGHRGGDCVTLQLPVQLGVDQCIVDAKHFS